MIRYISILFVAACLVVTASSNATQGKKPRAALQYDYALTLGEETFDPRLQVIAMPTQWQVASQLGHDLRLVQFDGPIQESWVTAMKEAGLTPVQYIHPFTYITWADPAARDSATALPHVRWSGDFFNGYRVLPKWRTLDARPIKARLLVYKEIGIDNVVSQLLEVGATRIDRSSLDHRFEVISFVVSGSSFLDISTIVGVYSVQATPTDGGLRSEMSNQVNAGNVDGSNSAFPGYQAWLDSIGLGGSGVTIAIVDGGSDENHTDLAGQFTACQGQSCGGNASSSHGTHTAGIVGATGASGTLDGFGFLRGQGVAPNVSLVEQVYSPTFQQPGGMTQLMVDSYANGASASSNSWGPAGSPQGYDIDTLEVDVAIRDADPSTPGNQQFSYVLAIMNGNGGTSSQGSPDEAKNIFTIGSTKMRSGGGAQILQINDISSNSAHGPCLDGRTIPHMVAPGCSVDSTVPGSHGLMCGTSMACPQVAGAIALFVEQYRMTEGVDPSPAMIKAAFTAAAKDLAGNADADGGTLGHPFDSKQGWGRMDLPSVLINPQGSVRYYDAPVILNQTGDQWQATVSPLDPSQPMRIMLVWTDALGHGLGGSTPAWNNDLDLTVSTGFSTYRGNNFGAQGWSITGGAFDGKNNTEGVFLGPTAPGQATITVTAANLNSDGIPGVGDGIDQDFSLVVYNGAAEPGFSVAVAPSSQPVCAPNSADFTVSIGQIMGYTEPIVLSGQAAGMSVSFSQNPVVPPADVLMTVTVPGSVSDGAHEVTVTGTSLTDGSLHNAITTVNVSSGLPTAPSLMSPANGATGVTVAPSFSWQPDSNVMAWRFQLSTTNSPNGIMHDASAITEPLYQLPMMLNSNTPYYWRVQGSNNCGDSTWSTWWSFTTTDAMTILLVDDDDNGPNVRNTYTQMLDNAGVLYDIYDTNNSNNEPDAVLLQGYPLVIWFTGDEWGGFSGPGGAGEAALGTYIDAGGHLVFSSQDYLYDNGLTSFGQTYLGIGSFTSDVGQSSVNGLEIFGDMTNVSLSYPFTNWSDIVSPSASALLAFSGNVGDAATLMDQPSGGGAAFLGFPIEAMSVSNQQLLMVDVLAWIGAGGNPCPADCNGDGVIDVIDLLGIIDAWGGATGCDINEDGIVDVLDILEVVGNWGGCP